MSDESLTLAKAATLYGVSVTTLRRQLRSGALRAEVRSNARAPYRVSRMALASAGLVAIQPDSHEYPDEYSRLLTEVEGLRVDLALMSSRAARAEGALEATRADFESLRDAIAPALAALSTRSAPPVIEVTPRRRWFSRWFVSDDA